MKAAIIWLCLAGFVSSDVIYSGGCSSRSCDSVGLFDCNDQSDGIYVDPCNCRCYYQCGGGYTEYHESCTNDATLFNPGTLHCDYEYDVNCGSTPVCEFNGDPPCVAHNATVTPPIPIQCSAETVAKCTQFGDYVDDENACDAMRCYCNTVELDSAIESPCAPGTVWCELAGSTDIWGCVPISGCNSDCYP